MRKDPGRDYGVKDAGAEIIKITSKVRLILGYLMFSEGVKKVKRGRDAGMTDDGGRDNELRERVLRMLEERFG